MPEYRRAFVPGGTFFFTVVTFGRQPLFRDDVAVNLLGSVLRRCRRRWQMDILAIVLLPDHWHTIWSMPSGDAEYSKRLGWIKKEFTKHWMSIGGSEEAVSEAKRKQRRRGVWQPRFWEHTIEDEADFQHHFDYVHWNPVKHGYVRCPRDWPQSSFHRWVQRGVYPKHWGCYTETHTKPPTGIDQICDAGEP